MQKARSGARRTASRAAALLAAASVFTAHAASCDFPPVKKQIDEVLDQDKAKGEQFRRMVKEGWDSIEAVSRLVPDAKMREAIDICRFDVAEYLTKRSFPPAH